MADSFMAPYTIVILLMMIFLICIIDIININS